MVAKISEAQYNRYASRGEHPPKRFWRYAWNSHVGKYMVYVQLTNNQTRVLGYAQTKDSGLHKKRGRGRPKKHG